MMSGRLPTGFLPRAFLAAALAWPALATSGEGSEPWRARDLTPVREVEAPRHPPVVLVRDGAAVAKVYVAERAPSANLGILLGELKTVVKLSSGAELEVVETLPPPSVPAIVVGDCEASRAAGIDAGRIPVEGFVVKTAPNRVFLVGSTQPLPSMDVGDLGGSPYANDGTAWALADFLERFAGVRWYWPVAAGGRSVVAARTLVVPPVHYSDQPAFRKREFYPRHGYGRGAWRSIWWDETAPSLPEALLDPPSGEIALQPLLAGLRVGSSWPYVIKVHEPQHFAREPQKWAAHTDLFQRNEDGTPDLRMLCYSSQKALDYLLQGCADVWDRGQRRSWVTTTSVTLSPGDGRVHCHCPSCAPLFEPWRHPYGTASTTVGLFVKRLCEAVKRCWPDKKVLYLAYWNYTECPEEIDFPDNLEVQMCTMATGLLRQPEASAQMEAQLRAWSRKVRGPVTTWEYSHRVPEWTYAAVQYPLVVRDYYRRNRGILAGSFLNGGNIGEWSTAAPTDHVFLKVLWNPDVDVDALLDELCRRMFGKAADTCRELLQLQVDRWEHAPWPRPLTDAGKVDSPILAATYPPAIVARMVELRGRARWKMAGDALAERRFSYWTWTFDRFLGEVGEAWGRAELSR